MKMKTIKVPADLFNEANRVVTEMIDRNKARKPIKRVVKISDRELKRMLTEGKAARKLLIKIEKQLNRDTDRLGDLQERSLTTSDEKWVDKQFDRLETVSSILELDNCYI